VATSLFDRSLLTDKRSPVRNTALRASTMFPLRYIISHSRTDNHVRSIPTLDPVNEGEQHVVRGVVHGVGLDPRLPDRPRAGAGGAVIHTRYEEEAVEIVERALSPRGRDEVVHTLGVSRRDELQRKLKQIRSRTYEINTRRYLIAAPVKCDELATSVSESGDVAIPSRNPSRIDGVGGPTP
jgi:hypothetical protein